MTLYTYKFDLIRVIDGDSLEVSIDLGFYIAKRTAVRIANIDAPETRTLDLNEKSYGLRAKAIVEEWFASRQGKEFIIKTELIDKYGRYLGHIYCEDEYLNEYLLNENFVWPYNGGEKVKNFDELVPLV